MIGEFQFFQRFECVSGVYLLRFKKSLSFLQPTTFNLTRLSPYIKYPSQELPFYDIIQNEHWQDDHVFTMQRLAGMNPMAIRKMTKEGKSKS